MLTDNYFEKVIEIEEMYASGRISIEELQSLILMNQKK